MALEMNAHCHYLQSISDCFAPQNIHTPHTVGFWLTLALMANQQTNVFLFAT